jgi:O-antigen ligase
MTPVTQSPVRAAAPATFWLAAALIALPFLQAWPIDFDRTAALVVLLPALWSGRRVLREAVTGLERSNAWIRTALTITGCAIVVSIYFSPHRAPALVAAASWLLLAAAGAIAGRGARADESASRQLLAGLALGVAAGAVAVWTLWLANGRGAVPLYAHHRIFGLHMLVGALAGTALAVRSIRAPQRWRWLAVGALNWGAVLWSGGRGPLVALAGGLVCWFLVCPSDRRRLASTTTLQLLAGLALSAVFWTPRPELGWWHAFSRTAAATQPGTIDVSALTSTRSEFWRASVQHGLRSPWIGHGPDAYRFFTPKLDGQQPHNVVLQLWLDLGLLGALPALVLLSGAVWFGWRLARRDDPGGAVAPWVALLAALLLGGLLDGIFYHVLTLLPAMLALGVVLFAIGVPDVVPVAGRRGPDALLAPALGGGALIVLALHACIFHALTGAPPPAGPEAAVARLVRAFPSTTFGLWGWLDQWHRTNPDAALAWARWAQTHATNPAIFHIRAAQYLQARGQLVAAREELSLAEAKAHWTSRPAISELRKNLSAAP